MRSVSHFATTGCPNLRSRLHFSHSRRVGETTKSERTCGGIGGCGWGVTNFCTVAAEGTFDCLVGSLGLCLGDFVSLSAWRPIIVTGLTGSSSVIDVPILGIFWNYTTVASIGIPVCPSHSAYHMTRYAVENATSLCPSWHCHHVYVHARPLTRARTSSLTIEHCDFILNQDINGGWNITHFILGNCINPSNTPKCCMYFSSPHAIYLPYPSHPWSYRPNKP